MSTFQLTKNSYLGSTLWSQRGWTMMPIVANAKKIRMIQQNHETAETLLHLLVNEATEYAIFQIDPQGVILNWNFGAQRMKQFTEAEAVGQNYRLLYRKEDQEEGRPELNIQLAIELGRHEEKWW